ncbi:hypothetical protein MO973_32595 [Paenibacillus sp. TRM 82003]|nr:hypothetical protein [Paenibacillus sp. TRM 82003]
MGTPPPRARRRGGRWPGTEDEDVDVRVPLGAEGFNGCLSGRRGSAVVPDRTRPGAVAPCEGPARRGACREHRGTAR